MRETGAPEHDASASRRRAEVRSTLPGGRESAGPPGARGTAILKQTENATKCAGWSIPHDRTSGPRARHRAGGRAGPGRRAGPARRRHDLTGRVPAYCRAMDRLPVLRDGPQPTHRHVGSGRGGTQSRGAGGPRSMRGREDRVPRASNSTSRTPGCRPGCLQHHCTPGRPLHGGQPGGGSWRPGSRRPIRPAAGPRCWHNFIPRKPQCGTWPAGVTVADP